MGVAYLLIFAALTLAAIRAEIWKRSADAIQARLQA
jgi:hypothetical protein